MARSLGTSSAQFCDDIEESLFAITAAMQKYEDAEALEAEALADLKQARQHHEDILRANGYKHLVRQDGLSIAVHGSPARLNDALHRAVREKRSRA